MSLRRSYSTLQIFTCQQKKLTLFFLAQCSKLHSLSCVFDLHVDNACVVCELWSIYAVDVLVICLRIFQFVHVCIVIAIYTPTANASIIFKMWGLRMCLHRKNLQEQTFDDQPRPLHDRPVPVISTYILHLYTS